MSDSNALRFHATVRTARASRNMTRLFKHFQHKVEVNYDEHAAYGDFPFGRCEMRALEDRLLIDCATANEEASGRMRHVIDDHLFRFSGEEGLEIQWQDGSHPSMV